jgi:hypothetical protein
VDRQKLELHWLSALQATPLPTRQIDASQRLLAQSALLKQAPPAGCSAQTPPEQ